MTKNILIKIIKLFLPTTFKNPTWLFMGSVLIWHMYQPMSVSLMSRICKYQFRCSVWVTAMRWFFVITWLCMVRIVWVSTLSHATWKIQNIFRNNFKLKKMENMYMKLYVKDLESVYWKRQPHVSQIKNLLLKIIPNRIHQKLLDLDISATQFGFRRRVDTRGLAFAAWQLS